jgi:hypothetical protein
MQQRGVTAAAGVFFLGLPRMYKVRSAFLWGVGEDAEFLAQQIERRSDVSQWVKQTSRWAPSTRDPRRT